MGRPRKYSDELRRRAIDEVLERDRKVPQVAKQLGITSPETPPLGCAGPRRSRADGRPDDRGAGRLQGVAPGGGRPAANDRDPQDVCVTVDSHDPAALAEFWSAALRWGGVVAASDGGGAVCGPADGGMYLEFVRVPESKTIKNRLHLGCNVGPIDEFDEEFERLRSLGAELAWREDFGADVDPHYRNWVLRDPEGNEFCLGGGTWPKGAATPSEVPIIHP